MSRTSHCVAEALWLYVLLRRRLGRPTSPGNAENKNDASALFALTAKECQRLRKVVVFFSSKFPSSSAFLETSQTKSSSNAVLQKQ